MSNQVKREALVAKKLIDDAQQKKQWRRARIVIAGAALAGFIGVVLINELYLSGRAKLNVR